MTKSKAIDAPRKGPNIIVLGAQSGIAIEANRVLASQGANFVLTGRSEVRLREIAEDLKARGAGLCLVRPGDLSRPGDTHAVIAQYVSDLGGQIDGVYVYFGVLGDNDLAKTDRDTFLRTMEVNMIAPADWCQASAGLLERQGRGALIVMSSVAGDRGRQSNYVYGAAKGGLTVLVEGLAHRLAPSGARATLVKLGFVDTAMTTHIKKGGPLWTQPAKIAHKLASIVSKPHPSVMYLPWFWLPIMTIIKAVPAFIFHKTKL